MDEPETPLSLNHDNHIPNVQQERDEKDEQQPRTSVSQPLNHKNVFIIGCVLWVISSTLLVIGFSQDRTQIVVIDDATGDIYQRLDKQTFFSNAQILRQKVALIALSMAFSFSLVIVRQLILAYVMWAFYKYLRADLIYNTTMLTPVKYYEGIGERKLTPWYYSTDLFGKSDFPAITHLKRSQFLLYIMNQLTRIQLATFIVAGVVTWACSIELVYYSVRLSFNGY